MQREEPGQGTEGLVQEALTGKGDSSEAALTVGGAASREITQLLYE